MSFIQIDRWHAIIFQFNSGIDFSPIITIFILNKSFSHDNSEKNHEVTELAEILSSGERSDNFINVAIVIISTYLTSISFVFPDVSLTQQELRLFLLFYFSLA